MHTARGKTQTGLGRALAIWLALKCLSSSPRITGSWKVAERVYKFAIEKFLIDVVTSFKDALWLWGRYDNISFQVLCELRMHIWLASSYHTNTSLHTRAYTYIKIGTTWIRESGSKYATPNHSLVTRSLILVSYITRFARALLSLLSTSLWRSIMYA